jgi:hypothetical protein
MLGFGRGRFEERPPPSWGMRVFASTCSAVSASVWKVPCVAPATRRRPYLPQRQSEPHLQLVQVQVGLQRSFCSV